MSSVGHDLIPSISSLILLLSWQILTSTALKKRGLSTGEVAAKYKYKNLLIDVKVDTESKVGFVFHLIILPWKLLLHLIKVHFATKHVMLLFMF